MTHKIVLNTETVQFVVDKLNGKINSEIQKELEEMLQTAKSAEKKFDAFYYAVDNNIQDAQILLSSLQSEFGDNCKEVVMAAWTLHASLAVEN